MIKNITRKDRKAYEAIVASAFTCPEATSVEDRNTLIRLVIQLDKACSGANLRINLLSSKEASNPTELD
jgi:hypothetical protein